MGVIMNKTDKKIKIWYPSVELGGGGYLSLRDPMDVINYVAKYPVQGISEKFYTEILYVESITLDCSEDDRADECYRFLGLLADYILRDELLYLPKIIIESKIHSENEVTGKHLRKKIRALELTWDRKHLHKQI